MPTTLEHENTILLTCGRTQLTKEDKSLLFKLLKKDINWDHLIQLAAHHKLLPLLYKHLSKNCKGKVPPQSMKQLQQFHNNNTLQNFKKLSALVQIESRFKENNIKTLSVKGPVLTYLYYNDISLRSFGDIDILVSQKDFKKATLLLKKMGYDYTPENIPEKYFFKFAQISHHGQLVNKYGIKIELHWELSGHYGAKLLDFQILKPFITTFEIQGCTLTTLCPEMLLVYLALHAQRHYWQRYDYLVCIGELLKKRPELDWKNVTNISSSLEIEQIVFLAIFMAHKLLNAPISTQIMAHNSFFDSLAKITVQHIENWEFLNQQIIKRNEAKASKWFTIYPINMRFKGRPYDAIRQYYMRYLVPETSDWKKFPMPYPLNTIYYITHPINKLLNLLKAHVANK